MIFCVFDVEANGLLPEVDTIYCVSYTVLDNNKIVRKGSITSYEEMVNLFKNENNKIDYFVGHNIILYDIKIIKKILDIDINGKFIDTIGLSYYVQPKLNKHGLEAYGEAFETPKVEILDWQNLTIEEYVKRCDRDVEINVTLFLRLFDYLLGLYGSMKEVLKINSYLTFKLSCIADQEDVGIKLDVEAVHFHKNHLENEVNIKTKHLSSLMPTELGKISKTKPKKPVKADGSLSAIGVKWYQYLLEKGLPLDTEVIRDPPNPASDVQLKSWLYSLGWQPETYKENDKKEMIPQVSLPFGQGLCPSVKALYEVEPGLEILDGYYKDIHRLGIFKSYLKDLDKNGYVKATARGFSKTLRLKHAKPIVNLPKPGVYYGKEVREVLVVPNDEYIMCGSDVSSLEDSTKQHYIYFYDPEYVKEMQVPGFDPHLDIGILAGIILPEESEIYKLVESDKEAEHHPDLLTIHKKTKKNRGTSKTANFAATYGAAGPKIADTAKISLEEGIALWETYWKRNWAVKQIAEDCTVKTFRGNKWLYNPLSGFWLYLEHDKDRFSALNQNTGVYVFDNWLKFIRPELKKLGITISMQYHDEIMFILKKEHKDLVSNILREGMKKVNEILKLNVEIKISIDFGNNYAEVH